jgi:hypothetical protein
MIQKRMAKIPMVINCPTQSLMTCKMNPWTGARITPILEGIEGLAAVPDVLQGLLHLKGEEEKRKLRTLR